MVGEARLLTLPLFSSNSNHQNNSTPAITTAHGDNAATSTTISATTPKRKKRGGVAPLLRQRRPGRVASTAKTTMNDDTSTVSTRTTRDDTSSTTQLTQQHESSSSPDIQIVGMGKLPPHNNPSHDNSTKVHKGSIRSGQLLSSDAPNQSLVIIGSVNPGGEVWSEGDVYVFGKLRGRVLAGLSNVGGDDNVHGVDSALGGNSHDESRKEEESPLHGNRPKKSTGSKIFATSFDPELVCIGNKFTTIDDVAQTCGLLDGVGPAMVTVDETTGELLFERIEL
mmetsp:Transcript_10261/g.22816  ORF Transcript_10261/g.22816 Transcript_10261/m.22816 type:complete len:281 (-) Transcript_10261:65-907(-)